MNDSKDLLSSKPNFVLNRCLARTTLVLEMFNIPPISLLDKAILMRAKNTLSSFFDNFLVKTGNTLEKVDCDNIL